jgi:DNA-binding beta-propeller fold protein YncE
MKRAVFIGGSLLVLLTAAGIAPSTFVTLAAQAKATAPSVAVDPLWPKPFPQKKAWILGSVTGVTVDAQDHIWVVHRGVDSLQTNEKGPALEPWASSCCFTAPQILEFDAAGTLLASWDPKTGTGYDWPHDPAGIAVDDKGNVWVAGGLPVSSLPAARGRGPAPAAGAAPPARGAAPAAAPAGRGAAPAAAAPAADAQVLKFDKTGKFVLQIGKAGMAAGSDSTTGLNKPGGVAVDSAANEVYVADGFANHRIAVFDATTGAFKRSWGAYGEKPADTGPGNYDPAAAPSKQFHTVSCVKIAKDGMVYVCDRQNDRIQVFTKAGKFVKEAFVSKTTTGDGSVWDIAFSPDQRVLFVADGHDKKVWMVDRASLETIGSFGDGGRYPGLFYGVGSVGVDSKGNVYTGETFDGKRVQKFVKK